MKEVARSSREKRGIRNKPNNHLSPTQLQGDSDVTLT